MASGVSASGKRNYTSAFNSSGNHLISGRPFAKTITVTHGSAIADLNDGIVTCVEPSAGNIDLANSSTINTKTVDGQLIKISFPSTMSSVQVSVQETSGANTAALNAKIVFVKPGENGASSSIADPVANGNYVQLGDTPTAPEGAVGFSTAMNHIYIILDHTGSGGAASNESVIFLITGHMPLNESDHTPAYDDTSTFVFGDTTGIG